MTEENADPTLNPFASGEAPRAALPRIWPVLVIPFAAVFLAIVFQVILAGVIVARLLARGVETSELPTELIESVTSPGMFLITIATGQIAFGGMALLAAYLSPEPMKQRFGFNSVRNPSKTYGLCMLGSIAPLAIALVCVLLVAKVIPPDKSFELLFEKLTPLWGIAFILMIAFPPGFFEEMLFRGYIQQRLLKRWSPWRAILVTSILFAIVHITPHGMAVAFPLGVWLGFIAWRTKSIGPSIACHAFVNGGLNIWRLVVKFGELSETVQRATHVIFVLIGTVCFVLACRMLMSYANDARSDPATTTNE